MLHVINNIKLIDSRTETHYRFHTKLDLDQYPQVHDFWEIVLVTYGTLYLTLCGTTLSLTAGHMALIRAGDIHAKSGKDCAHINLAFPTTVLDELFGYLCNEGQYEALKELPLVSPVRLSQPELFSLKERMERLNTISVSEYGQIRTNLRRILFEVITFYFLPALSPAHAHSSAPQWLSDALTQWQSNEHRSEGLRFFCEYTGYSKEHICRTFKRCFGTPLTVYLNRQRLNYAVNLLLHTDYSVTDIAYEAGFSSPSRFYHLFHETYGISPKQFFAQYNPSVFGEH